MLVLLLRHGKAGPAGPGIPDRERRLTPEGIEQVRNVVRQASAGIPAPVVVSSPYVRAVETAALANEVWGGGLEMQRSSALTPESSATEAWDEIRTHAGTPALLLVGHEPLFSSLAAFLLGHGDLAIDVGTATLVCIDVLDHRSRPRGVLKWMLTPRLAGL